MCGDPTRRTTARRSGCRTACPRRSRRPTRPRTSTRSTSTRRARGSGSTRSRTGCSRSSGTLLPARDVGTYGFAGGNALVDVPAGLSPRRRTSITSTIRAATTRSRASSRTRRATGSPPRRLDEIAARFEAAEAIGRAQRAARISAAARDGAASRPKKPGRNDLCMCGSMRKWKQCCGARSPNSSTLRPCVRRASRSASLRRRRCPAPRAAESSIAAATAAGRRRRAAPSTAAGARAAAADAAPAAQLRADRLRRAARDRSGEARRSTARSRSPARSRERSSVIWLHGRHLDDPARARGDRRADVALDRHAARRRPPRAARRAAARRRRRGRSRSTTPASFDAVNTTGAFKQTVGGRAVRVHASSRRSTRAACSRASTSPTTRCRGS